MQICNTSISQIDSNKIFSHLYFPFDFGYSITKNASMQPSLLVKTGVEYRINKTKGLFFRFNYDNHRNGYKIDFSTATNVTEGKLPFTYFSIGAGWRSDGKRIKGFGLIQPGISYYQYGTITGNTGTYKIDSHTSYSPLVKTTLGMEYYLDREQTVALTIETNYYSLMKSSDYWGAKFSFLAFSFGLTTTLF